MEEKKTIMSKTDAMRLKNLIENDFPALAAEVDNAIKKSERFKREIRRHQYCEHLWHSFDRDEIAKMGTPVSFGIQDWDKEMIEAFYMDLFGYCEKCGLKYKYRCFTDEDYERIYIRYDSDLKITYTFGSTFYKSIYEEELEHKKEAASMIHEEEFEETLKKIEDDIKRAETAGNLDLLGRLVALKEEYQKLA